MSSPVEGTPTAGDVYSLVCDVSRADTLASSTILEVMWWDNNGALISSGSGLSITGPTSTTDTTLTSTLTFTPLKTSQGGMYTCAVNMTIPEGDSTVQDFQVTSTAQVSLRSELTS